MSIKIETGSIIQSNWQSTFDQLRGYFQGEQSGDLQKPMDGIMFSWGEKPLSFAPGISSTKRNIIREHNFQVFAQRRTAGYYDPQQRFDLVLGGIRQPEIRGRLVVCTGKTEDYYRMLILDREGVTGFLQADPALRNWLYYSRDEATISFYQDFEEQSVLENIVGLEITTNFGLKTDLIVRTPDKKFKANANGIIK